MSEDAPGVDALQGIGADALIAEIYRGILSRDPDPAGISYWKAVLDEKKSVSLVLKDFLRSAEFRGKVGGFVDLYRHDQAPRQTIEYQVGPSDLNRLWDHVSRTWSRLGTEDPYFSVLTDPQYHGQSLTQEEIIEQFYNTAAFELRRLDSWLSRNGLSPSQDGVFVEYGCGVGRCTEWLAQRFRRVVALDISRNHLEAARGRAKKKNLLNIDYAQVETLSDLNRLSGIDFFYSIIVLQHNPPPIIYKILDRAFSGLKRGGIAFFQLPTYGADGYRFVLKDYLGGLNAETMEMHALEQSAVFGLAGQHGLKLFQASPDHCTGELGISTTFLFQKA